MSNDTQSLNDPLSFVRNLWSGMGLSMPGMVAPTFDVDELDKRITDMKAVEGWLRMNLSMLQMTIQGLEMQRTTLSAVQTMGQMASDAAKSMKPEAAAEPTAVDAAGAFSGAAGAAAGAAMWPWQMMQQISERMQQGAAVAGEPDGVEQTAPKPARRSRK